MSSGGSDCIEDHHHDDLEFSGPADEDAVFIDPMLVEASVVVRPKPGHEPSPDLGQQSAGTGQAIITPPHRPINISTPAIEDPKTLCSASFERRLQHFAGQVAKPARKPLLRLQTPRQPRRSPKPAVPSRSRRIAAQSIAHIPASKRGEYLVRKRLGEKNVLPASTAALAYDDIYGPEDEHATTLRELFPDDVEVGPRRRGRQPAVKA